MSRPSLTAICGQWLAMRTSHNFFAPHFSLVIAWSHYALHFTITIFQVSSNSISSFLTLAYQPQGFCEMLNEGVIGWKRLFDQSNEEKYMMGNFLQAHKPQMQSKLASSLSIDRRTLSLISLQWPRVSGARNLECLVKCIPQRIASSPSVPTSNYISDPQCLIFSDITGMNCPKSPDAWSWLHRQKLLHLSEDYFIGLDIFLR